MIRKQVVRVCVGVLFLFMGSIFLRFLTLNLLMERLHIRNTFTRIVFFDRTISETEVSRPSIDWTRRYPFTTAGERIPNQSSKLKQRITDIEKKIEKYTQDDLTNRVMFVELAVLYEKAIGWNILNGGVVDLGAGYFTEVVKNDLTPVSGLYAFHDFLQGLGIDLVYVQSPHKIAPQDGISGVTDFSNENADALLAALSVKQIPYLDLRKNIREENLDHHRLFYKTDHHWKAETGLWASRILMNHLNEQYGFTFDVDMANPEQYRYTRYQDWFLGSLGKKITLLKTPAEDFTLISPRFDTDFSVSIPEINLETRGDFTVFIDYSQVERKDYYTLSPYGAYLYGDRQVIRIHNNRIHDGKHILLIKDSFANVIAPFVSLGVADLHILDLRYFNGSVQTYIEQHHPDMVMVMYNPSALSYTGHEKMFDFR